MSTSAIKIYVDPSEWCLAALFHVLFLHIIGFEMLGILRHNPLHFFLWLRERLSVCTRRSCNRMHMVARLMNVGLYTPDSLTEARQDIRSPLGICIFPSYGSITQVLRISAGVYTYSTFFHSYLCNAHYSK